MILERIDQLEAQSRTVSKTTKTAKRQKSRPPTPPNGTLRHDQSIHTLPQVNRDQAIAGVLAAETFPDAEQRAKVEAIAIGTQLFSALSHSSSVHVASTIALECNPSSAEWTASRSVPTITEVEENYDVANDLDDGRSMVSSYPESVFSEASLASSMTLMSQRSGYSVTQIETATKALLNILQKDPVLDHLYRSAIDCPQIGAERFERNLLHMLKSFARNLREESTDQLEYLASKLVAGKARFIARSIVQKYAFVVIQRSTRQELESSEDEDEAEPEIVDDNNVQDLVAFHDFIVGAVAFKTLRTQIQSSIVPQLPTVRFWKSSKQQILVPHRTWQSWRSGLARILDALLIDKDIRLSRALLVPLLFDAFALTTDTVCIATGLLEQRLLPGMVRLRWTCRCGDKIFSDVRELQKYGVRELVSRMEGTSGIKVTSTPYREHSSNQQYALPRPFRWSGSGTFVPVASKRQDHSPPRTEVSSSRSTATSTSSQATVRQKTVLHLLACLHNKRSSKVLQQDRIENVTTDSALVQFMRTQYRRQRSRLRSILSLKTIQGIFFVKFDLPMGNNVIIRPHGTSCMHFDQVTNNSPMAMCECLPPRSRVEPRDIAEYHCHPVPPKTFPPVTPEYLLSLFTCQEEPHCMSRWIVEQIPKRQWGQLFGRPEQPAEGWGIYYKEGWDTALISVAVLLLLSTSLLFSILWSSIRSDIQGAFGVGAWMVGIGGALLAVIVT